MSQHYNTEPALKGIEATSLTPLDKRVMVELFGKRDERNGNIMGWGCTKGAPTKFTHRFLNWRRLGADNFQALQHSITKVFKALKLEEPFITPFSAASAMVTATVTAIAAGISADGIAKIEKTKRELNLAQGAALGRG